MAEVTVVNGLLDVSLKLELLAMTNLTWDKLVNILTCKGSAENTISNLSKPFKSPPVIKTEVAYNIKSHSHKGHSLYKPKSDEKSYNMSKCFDNEEYSDYPENDPVDTYCYRRKKCFECGSGNHLLRHCRYVTCFICGDKGHTSMDCFNINQSVQSHYQCFKDFKHLDGSSPDSFVRVGRGRGVIGLTNFLVTVVLILNMLLK